jgi:hypothetical protein
MKYDRAMDRVGPQLREMLLAMSAAIIALALFYAARRYGVPEPLAAVLAVSVTACVWLAVRTLRCTKGLK